jgi:PAS domain S-box-containing protein
VGAVGLFSDISAHKAAAQQISLTSELLAQKSRVLATTLDSLDQGVMGVDAQGHINAWNQRLLALLDLPPALLEGGATLAQVGRYLLEQGHFGPQAERLTGEARHNLMAFLAGQAIPREQRYQRVRVDGTVLDVHVLHASDGSHVRTFTDVTANVRAQQALRESESRFRRMADAAPALIWLSDQDGQATWFNQRWLHSVGQTMDQALSEGWGSRLHPDDLAACRDRFAQAFVRREPYDIEFRVRRFDGTVQWVADTGIPRFALDGSFEGFISYGWDITGRKAAEVALIAAKTEAERANRAKSQFLSRMSHELRTPLNAILGFGQLLANDPQEPLGQTQRRRLQEIERGGHHLLTLINDVLDLSRIEAGALQLQAQAVDLAVVMGDCLRLVEPVARERDISLSLAIPEGTATWVMADATRLRQVLLNLLGNAIKYNREGGMVALVCQVEPRHLLLEVSDCGPGLTEEQQRRLFQAFERLDADHSGVEGAGVGLALSKWLVELMQGEIGVRSQPGVGSTFWLRLQRHTSEALPPALPYAAATGQAPARDGASADGQAVQRVLYVEDNTVNQVLMEGMLSHRPGLALQLADRPSVGLAMARAQRPDLVLLDIQLPEMDGVALMRALRAMPSMAGVPMIAVSANAMPSDLQAALEAGFDDSLTKPLELGRLLAAVNRALDR